jgi:MoaA/NifB/PqqE/SkfB family radical SAM enzyme
MPELEIENYVTMHLSNTYDILYLEKIKYFFESPINQIYQKLAKIKRNSYNNNQRIVLIDNLTSIRNKQYFYNHLQKIINHLDITNCFVLIVTSDSDVVSYLDFARNTYSQDQTHIQIEQMILPNENVTNPTNFNIPDTICVNPWIGLEIRYNGHISPCCVYKNLHDSKSIVDHSLLDIINSDSQVNLKQQFLQGQQPIGCQKCWDDEYNSKPSKRLLDNYVFREKLFDIDYNNTSSTALLSLDIKLKNTCNLSCRICNPVASSKWQSEWSNNIESYPQWDSLKNIKINWSDDASSRLWKDIEQISNEIQYITFSGGEPLLDKSHVDMLKYFVNKNKSEISLHYNTNGTVYASHLIPLWDKFKQVELSFSIDNIESKFEYERYGSTWNTVIDTINQYKQLELNVYKFNVYVTVTVLNILDLYDVFQFCKQYDLPVVFNTMTIPEELNIGVFGKKQKDYISNKLLTIQDNEFHQIIMPIINLMNNQITQCSTTDMINYLSVTDKIRFQNFRKTYSELSSILN